MVSFLLNVIKCNLLYLIFFIEDKVIYAVMSFDNHDFTCCVFTTLIAFKRHLNIICMVFFVVYRLFTQFCRFSRVPTLRFYLKLGNQ